MKKQIICTIAFITTSVLIATGQNSHGISARVTEGFRSEFSDASNVRWEELPDNVYLVRFNQADRNLLAYFDGKGHLLISGRKITIDEAPKPVQTELGLIMKSRERKSGALLLTHLYEINDEGETDYYANIGNNNLYLAVRTRSNGKGEILRKMKGGNQAASMPLLVRVNRR